jgi:hypothetical protein
MNERRARSGPSPALATTILVLFSLAGLVGGLLTHSLVSAASGVVRIHATATSAPHTIATPHSIPTAVATQAGPEAHFTLALAFSPARAVAHQPLTISVTASVNGTSIPVAHLLCTLSAPGNGAPLLNAWPSPTATNAKGLATWQITIPGLAPGLYGVKVSASSTDGYSAYWVDWLSVTG